ncbi:hypothetical protein ACH5RR_034635 [Cinchona calisaya]|uniref:Uncharacterized protein n=1 Tax=Cinchona calisaya TaxID=153742 RepID=A0ABD2YBG8_9GENT
MFSSSYKINTNCKVFKTVEPMAKSLVSHSSTSQPFRPLHRSQNLAYGPPIQHLQTLKKTKRNLLVIVHSSVQPGDVPPPPGSPSSSWKGWLLAIVFTVALPFVANKWGPLMKLIKGEVETAVETAEELVSTVEKASEEVEKVAEEIADKLPEGGKLKSAVISVEKVAKMVDKDAHLAGDFVAKVEETEVKVESVVEAAVSESQKTKDQK